MEKIGIIILNWNTSKDTIECLDSLKEQKFKDFKIYLVDNASKESEKKILKNYIKKESILKIKFIENKENLGFAGGNNSALKEAKKHEHVFLLNNDTTLDKNCLVELVKTINLEKNIGAVNPKIYYFDKKDTIWATGANFNNFLLKASLRGIKEKDNDQYNKEEKLDQLVGAAVLIKSEALKKSGFFDEKFFCYYEETDLFQRIKEKGFKLYYSPKSIVYHKVALSSGGIKNPKTVYYLVRNRGLFIVKNFKGLKKFIGISSLLIECSIRIIIYILKLSPKRINATLNGFIDFLKSI
ncbi:MAG: glycosyltransferase family 2 protein [Candidatus ainarchaeum sp.]|nr:glycosyltransferase family 2 protein [Candidatus ainarchaeum sp.]